jgi:hypothetical protein
MARNKGLNLASACVKGCKRNRARGKFLKNWMLNEGEKMKNDSVFEGKGIRKVRIIIYQSNIQNYEYATETLNIESHLDRHHVQAGQR